MNNSHIHDSPSELSEAVTHQWIDAAKNGHMAVLTHLLEQGFPVNWQDSTGWSALFHAIWHLQNEVIDFLTPLSDLKQVDMGGWNALIFSVQVESLEHVRKFSSLIDPNYRDLNGQNALMHAVVHDVFQSTQLLTPLTDLSKSDLEGYNALMLAAAYGRAEFLSYLIPYTVNLHQHNRNGESVFDLAKNHDDPSMLNELLRADLARRENKLLSDTLTDLPHASPAPFKHRL